LRRSANALNVTAPDIAPHPDPNIAGESATLITVISDAFRVRTAMIYVGVAILVLIAGLGWSVLKLVDNFGKTGGEM